MIEELRRFIENMNTLTFIWITIIMFVSYGIAKIKYIKKWRGEKVLIEDPDNMHLVDKMLLIVGTLIVIYLIVTGNVDRLVKVLRSYDIVLLLILAIGIPILIFFSFLKSMTKYLETSKSLRTFAYEGVIELGLAIFYVSFLGIFVPFLLYFLKVFFKF